jgi:hypothetical protein
MEVQWLVACILKGRAMEKTGRHGQACNEKEIPFIVQ